MPEQSYIEYLKSLGATPVSPELAAEIREMQEKAAHAILNDRECLDQARQMIATHAHGARMPHQS